MVVLLISIIAVSVAVCGYGYKVIIYDDYKAQKDYKKRLANAKKMKGEYYE